MDAENVVCVLLSGLALSLALQDSEPVKTNVGTFVGFKKDVATEDGVVEISKFLGIPYAEPPVGNLRFRKPVPKAALKEPLVTQQYGLECAQVKLLASGATSEDCLYLNVYVPPTETVGAKKAVMVWIHGGGFFTGSANVYVADRLAVTGDVVVVTINYRVSALGFLNVGDSNAPGNYGLWDQHLAIKWVHANIDEFGGDAERITIFGESAGSASVIYQGIYPGNRGIFHRIIAQSGSAAAPWAITQKANEEAKELAKLVDCERDNTKDMTECLRTVPIDAIEAAINGEKLVRNPFPFLPSVDNDFIKVLPRSIFDLDTDVASAERDTLASFDLLTGVNYAEGAMCVSPFCGIVGDVNKFMPSRDEFENTLVPFCAQFMYGKEASTLFNDFIIAEYTDWNDPENPLAIREQFVAMHGDSNFVAPTHATINLHLNRSENAAFLYHFTASMTQHIMPMPSWIKKAVHADDIMYVFGSRADFMGWGAGNDDFNALEKELSNSIMIMWTNFAKTGNPNKPRDINVDWPPFTAQSHSYLDIAEELSLFRVKDRLDERRANLWNHLLPKMVNSLSHSQRSLYQATCDKSEGCSP